MPVIEIGMKQIKEAIQQLTIPQKAKIIEELEKQSWQFRFRQLLKRIDQRFQKHSLPDKKIDKIVEEAKAEYYAQNRNRH